MARSGDHELTPGLSPPGRATPAAVLVLLVERAHGWQMVLTRRPRTMRDHPGQIAFAGGKIDADDADAAGAALREAREEIGLQQAELIGRLGSHHTVTGFLMTPVLAIAPPDFTPAPQSSEVEEAFEVPLDFLRNPVHLRTEARPWRGSLRKYYVIPYGPYYIWGATARIIARMQDAWPR